MLSHRAALCEVWKDVKASPAKDLVPAHQNPTICSAARVGGDESEPAFKPISQERPD